MSRYKQPQKVFDRWALRWQQWRFSTKEQCDYLRDIIELLPYQSNISILEHLVEYSEGGKQQLSQILIKELEAGRKMADGMPGWFDPVLVSACRIGEEEGVLISSLGPVLDSVEQQSGQWKKSLMKLIEPIILTLAALVIFAFLRVYLMPMLLDMSRGDISQFPLPTWLMWQMAEKGNTVVLSMTVIVIGFILVLRNGLVNYIGQYRQMLDSLPLFSHYRLYLGAQFMRTYVCLKRVNTDDQEIINQIKKEAGPYYTKHLNLFFQDLIKGQDNIADIINTGLIDSELIARFRMLAASKNFIEAIEKASKQVDKQLISRIDVMVKTISYIWRFLIGLVVVVFILGVVSIGQLAAQF